MGSVLAVWLAAHAVGGAAPVEVPLYRGRLEAHRPLVRVVGPDGTERFAVLDLAWGPSVVGRQQLAAWGVATRVRTVSGGSRAEGVVPTLRIGSLQLHDVPVRVGAGWELVLGTAALPDLAVAVLPSAGVSRWARREDAPALLASVGRVEDLDAPLDRAWWEHGRRAWRDGPSLGIYGEVSWGEARVEGVLGVDTSAVRSVLDGRLPTPAWPAITVGGVPETPGVVQVEGTAGQATWFRRQTAPAYPDPRAIGTLGYDVLFGLDVAVWGERREAAFAPVAAPRWAPAGPLFVADLRARAAAEAVQTAWTQRALARDLWTLGEVDAALEAATVAAELEPGGCATRLERATMLRQLGELSEADDEQEAALALWDAWASLGVEGRERVRRGQGVDGEPQPQDTACRPERVEAPVSASTSSGWAAERAVRSALAAGHPTDADLALSLAAAQADTDQLEPARAGLAGLPWQWTDHPLTVAVLAHALSQRHDLGLVSPGLEGHRTWAVAGHLAEALLGRSADLDAIEASLHVLAGRRADALGVEALDAALRLARGDAPAAMARLDGLAPPHPDVFLVRALAAPTASERAAHLAALGARWPMIPVDLWADRRATPPVETDGGR